MDKVIVRSVYDAFEYVMDHYYPNGQEEYAPRKDTYAVISIQDTHTDGFGFVFTKTRYCKDVLTLYFDDIFKEVRGAVLFSEEQAEEIISFIWKSRNANTLLPLLRRCFQIRSSRCFRSQDAWRGQYRVFPEAQSEQAHLRYARRSLAAHDRSTIVTKRGYRCGIPFMTIRNIPRHPERHCIRIPGCGLQQPRMYVPG